MNLKFLSFCKIAIVFSFLFVCIPNVAKSQTVESALEILSDDAFSDWSRSWYYDKYLISSAKITSYRETSDNQIQGEGYFKFSRMGQKFTANFTVRVKSGSSKAYVTRLCYTDPSTEQSDCYTP